MRQEAGTALIVSTILTSQGVKKQDGGRWTPADFMPWASDNDPLEDSVQSIAQLMKAPT